MEASIVQISMRDNDISKAKKYILNELCIALMASSIVNRLSL
jgi:hypothetical protein